MKDRGLVFGGIIRFPRHPDANLHGEVRCIIRTRLFSQVIHALSRYGIDVWPRDLGRNWAVSESLAEHHATAYHYGEVLVAPITIAYLSAAAYRLAPDSLKLSKPEGAA